MSSRLWTLAFFASVLAVVACGARTGLEVEPTPPPPEPGPDAGDAAADVPPDVPPDVPADVPFDAPPPICVDGSVTFIYVVTQQNTLYSFYPPDGSFTYIGTIACPVFTPGATPYSMAVDRGGTAYVVFSDGHLFLVSTADAHCAPTDFAVGQHGFLTFGMGFSSDMNDSGETLFVSEASFNMLSKGLATIDTTTLALSYIGPYSPELPRAELTGTGDGRLFAFSLDLPGPGSHISEIDKATANILSSDALAIADQSDAFAYAFWGGSFYVFTSPGGPSEVTRYDPITKTLQPVGSHPETIVGAGVSTCAPH